MESSRSCPECSTTWDGDARFCGRCGALLQPHPRAATGDATAGGTTPEPRGEVLQTRSGLTTAFALLGVVALLTLAALVRSGAPSPTGDPDPSPGERQLVDDLVRAGASSFGGLRWERPIDGAAGVVGRLGTLFVHDGRRLLALNRGDGSVVWSETTPLGTLLEPFASGVPLLGVDDVLRVHAASSGVTWSRPGVSSDAPALTVGGFLFVADGDEITSWRANGSILWQIGLRGVRHLTGGSGGSGLLLASTTDEMHAIHPLTGAIAWSVNLPPNHAPPHLAGNLVVVADGEGTIQARDHRTGDAAWTIPAQGTIQATSLSDGTLLVVDRTESGSRLRFLNPNDGGELDAVGLGEDVHTVAAIGTYAVVVDEDHVTAWRPAIGQAWRFDNPVGKVVAIQRSGDDLLLVTPSMLVAVHAPVW